MKSILEKALVHLLNEENEKAQELMHQFVVERAKEIHESLRESDEADMEAIDDETLEEEFFTEADLEDAEAVDNLEDDLDDDTVADEELAPEGDMTGEVEPAADEMEAEVVGDEGAEEEGSVEDKLESIEDEIAALQAEFDRVMAEFEGGDDEGEEITDEADVDIADAELDGSEEVAADDEEDFADITESMVDDLKKVATPNADGKGANGEKLGHPEFKSPVAKDAKASAIVTKNPVGHTGFDREAAPSKKEGRKYDNIRSKATDGNSAVPAAGPKKAELAKPVAGNTKSPIAGSKKK